MLDLVRGRRRTFSSILGIVLAVAFLSGTFIAIDSSARATLEGLLANVRGDFWVAARQGNLTGLQATLEEHPGVEEATAYYNAYLPFDGSEVLLPYGEATVLFVDPSHLPRVWRQADVSGPLDLPRGTIALTQALAAANEVGLGDPFPIRNVEREGPGEEEVVHWLNLTVVALLSRDVESVGFVGPFPGYEERVAFVHFEDLTWFQNELGLPPSFGQLWAEVWIDRGQFVDPYNIQGSRHELARFGRGLEAALRPYGGLVHDNITNALNTFEIQSSGQRVIYLFLSAPVLLLGLYLGAVGVDLGHAERRRELAVLKARGAGRGQVMSLLLVGAALGGLLATVIGLAAGVGVSRLLLNLVNPFALSAAPSLGDFVLSPLTVLTMTLFSVLFMLLASYRSAKRTARLPVVETLRYHAPGETRIEYRPTLDIVLVSVGAAGLIGVWYVQANPGTFVGFLLGIVFTLLLPLAPIFLIVGGTRLLTRSTGRIYGWAARLWKPLAGNLYHIISRNLARNPRRSSNVAIIVALGLAFGVFIFAFLGTTLANQERVTRAQVGADMSVTMLAPVDASFLQNVSDLPQVAGVTTVRRLSGEVYSQFIDIAAVEPQTHFEVTQPERWYFDGLSAGGATNILEGGEALASEALARSLFLEVGDRLTVQLHLLYEVPGGLIENVTALNVSVGGIVRALPGTGTSAYSLPRALYISRDALDAVVELPEDGGGLREVTDQVLVDLHPGADWEEAKAAILGMDALNVRVYEEELLRQQVNPVFASVLGFITMEVAFIVAILTAGLGLILFAATLERDVEFAAVRARGASGWQAAGVLVGEAFSILLVGLAVGVVVGLLVAFVLFQVVLVSFGGSEPLVPFLFELPPEGFLLLGLAPLAMLLTALLIAWRIVGMNLARVLKMRGG